MNIIAGMMMPRDELGPEARLVELLVLLARRPRSASRLAAEDLDQRVAGERLLDVAR